MSMLPVPFCYLKCKGNSNIVYQNTHKCLCSAVRSPFVIQHCAQTSVERLGVCIPTNRNKPGEVYGRRDACHVGACCTVPSKALVACSAPEYSPHIHVAPEWMRGGHLPHSCWSGRRDQTASEKPTSTVAPALKRAGPPAPII